MTTAAAPPLTLSSAGAAALAEAFGERFSTAPEDLAHWGRDWTRSFTVAPSAVLFPETEGEVQTLVGLARAHGFKLVPSGGRTGLSGGAVAPAGEVVVSFDRMNKVLGFDPAGRLLRCQPGVVVAEVAARAEAEGLYYPVDFASARRPAWGFGGHQCRWH